MNTGGPAFPVQDTVYPNGQVQNGTYGMTLLDWYAGQALAGLMASQIGGGPDDSYANSAYDLASAMLAEKARREAVVKQSSTTDHSPDAGKMAEIQAANRELVKALEGCLQNIEQWCPVKHREARATLSKHKESK